MARCLIIACGCRGQSLARELVARGHVVRGTTRRADLTGAIEAAGAEAVIGDPDRIATLVPALDHVSVAVVLLGGASGTADEVAELHGSRLEMLLLRMLDTTIRGIVYEAAGSAPADVLAHGASIVADACERSRIPFSLLSCDPAVDGYEAWVEQALGSVERVLVT